MRVRSSSPEPGFTSRQCPCLLDIRQIGKGLQLAGLKRCRETFHEETPRVTGMISRLRPLARTRRFAVAAAINKATCERRPTLCRNDRPGPRRRQIDGTKIHGPPYFDGGQIRRRAWIGREGPSRGEARIRSDHTALHGCLTRRSFSNCESSARYSAITALTTCTIPPPTAAG